MSNFYQILGISYDADAAQIRTAYKRLAMAYHPDHNPGNADAEEVFKIINEAYHTLSDPTKKAFYDAQIHYEPPAIDPVREAYRQRYYRWRRAQERTYVIDREYFKVQGLAFLVFTVIAGFCFGLMHTATYMVERKQLKHYQATTAALLRVDTLFTTGHITDAFILINDLTEKEPLEYRYNYARDSLLSALRQMADDRYVSHDFATAVAHYQELKKHENPVRTETIRQIALCAYYLGDYAETLQALKHLHNQSPRNLQLIFEIGLLNLEKLDDPKEAARYLSLGVKLFQRNLTEVYGVAFESTIKSAEVPDIYFDIFQARAMANNRLQQYADAAADCNWAIRLRPAQSLPYKLRAEANAGRHVYAEVCTDLARARRMGRDDTAELQRRYCRQQP